MPDPFLSICIIAGNEERHIGNAIRSATPVADELVVLVDSRATDRTAEIAREHGAIVFYHPFVSFGQQRNCALDRCSGAWVLFLDADERLTPELGEELGEWREEHRTENKEQGDGRTENQEPETEGRFLDFPTLNTQHPTPDIQHPAPSLQVLAPSSYTGYWIPRYNLYFGRALRGGGWYPDRQLRLLKRDRARYDETRLVHEVAALDGEAGTLNGHFLHINIETWRELRIKQRRYAIAEAQTLAQEGVRARWRNLILQPLREVRRRFVTWHGYRDRVLGLTLALVMGYYEWIKYVHLMALRRAVRE